MRKTILLAVFFQQLQKDAAIRIGEEHVFAVVAAL